MISELWQNIELMKIRFRNVWQNNDGTIPLIQPHLRMNLGFLTNLINDVPSIPHRSVIPHRSHALSNTFMPCIHSTTGFCIFNEFKMHIFSNFSWNSPTRHTSFFYFLLFYPNHRRQCILYPSQSKSIYEFNYIVL